MKIRIGGPEDVDAAVRMGLRFVAESSYRGFVDPDVDAMRKRVQLVVEQGALFLAEAGGDVVGLLALMPVPLLFTGEIAIADVAWWVEPEWRHPRSSAGGRLLVTGEGWAMEVARTLGMPSIWLHMMAPHGGDPQVGVIYKRRGYLPLETVFAKRLPAAA